MSRAVRAGILLVEGIYSSLAQILYLRAVVASNNQREAYINEKDLDTTFLGRPRFETL